jgi:hypothetical protein
MLQAIAKGLRISAQTLYVQAGILDEEPKADVQAAIMGDPGLTERQKQALLAVYDSFREETERRRTKRADAAPAEEPARAAAPDKITDLRARRTRRARSQTGGGAKSQADAKPSPGSPSSPRPQPRSRAKGGTR